MRSGRSNRARVGLVMQYFRVQVSPYLLCAADEGLVGKQYSCWVELAALATWHCHWHPSHTNTHTSSCS